MRALALHEDVLLVTSALLPVNCVIVRGAVDVEAGAGVGEGEAKGLARGVPSGPARAS